MTYESTQKIHSKYLEWIFVIKGSIWSLEMYPARYTDTERRDEDNSPLYERAQYIGTESSENKACDDISRIVNSANYTSDQCHEGDHSSDKEYPAMRIIPIECNEESAREESMS
jgi:hypothetical protein